MTSKIVADNMCLLEWMRLEQTRNKWG